jgi:hypothetical protein
MTMIVHVSDADLRGRSLREFAPVLQNLVGEMYGICPEVLPGEKTRVIVADPDGPFDAGEILKMARTITRPSYEALFR